MTVDRRDYFNRRRREHVEAGICAHCNEPAVSESMCQSHLDEQRTRYAERRAARQCVRCRSDSGEYALCQSCRYVQAARKRQERASKKDTKPPLE